MFAVIILSSPSVRMCANMREYVTNLVVNHCPHCSNTLPPELLLSLLSQGATKTEPGSELALSRPCGHWLLLT